MREGICSDNSWTLASYDKSGHFRVACLMQVVTKYKSDCTLFRWSLYTGLTVHLLVVTMTG